jgi:hypothetical protein
LRSIHLSLSLILMATFAYAGPISEYRDISHMESIARSSKIIPAEMLSFKQSLSYGEYGYLLPKDGKLSLTMRNRFSEISTDGQIDYLQLGVRAPVIPPSERPPLNLAIVLDGNRRLDHWGEFQWIKVALLSFIDTLQDHDQVSIALFHDDSPLIFPMTVMDSSQNRLAIKEFIQSISTGKPDFTFSAAREGYSQVEKSFDDGKINQVLFIGKLLGDEVLYSDRAQAFQQEVIQFQQKGIPFSALLLETRANRSKLMSFVELGGGTTVIVSNKDELMDLLKNNSARLFYPAAHGFEGHIALPSWMSFQSAWGMDYQMVGQTLMFSMPTLNSGEEATFLVKVEIDSGLPLGQMDYPSSEINYIDRQRQAVSISAPGPTVDFSPRPIESQAQENLSVLQAQTYVDLTLTLKSLDKEKDKRELIWNDIVALREQAADLAEPFESELLRNQFKWNYTSPETDTLERAVKQSYKRDLQTALDTIVRILKVQRTVGPLAFELERRILREYVKTYLDRLEWDGSSVHELLKDGSILEALDH